MLLKNKIHRGDWIVATNIDTKASITGQAAHKLQPIGPALLEVMLEPDKSTMINVNFWDVDVIHRNMLGEGE